MSSWTNYEKRTIESIEDLSSRMRWKIFHHKKKIKDRHQNIDRPSVLLNNCDLIKKTKL